MESAYDVCKDTDVRQEGEEGNLPIPTIDEKGEDGEGPEIVKVMIKYLYTLDYYPENPVRPVQQVTSANNIEPEDEQLTVPVLEDDYGFSASQKKGKKAKKGSSWRYESPPTPPRESEAELVVVDFTSNEKDDTDLFDHAQVFAIAVKFQVHARQKLAAEKFAAAAERG